jgi:hypothetical protein
MHYGYVQSSLNSVDIEPEQDCNAQIVLSLIFTLTAEVKYDRTKAVQINMIVRKLE